MAYWGPSPLLLFTPHLPFPKEEDKVKVKKNRREVNYAHILFLKVIFNSKKIYVYGGFALTDGMLYACQVPTEGRRRLQIHWKWS